MGIATACGMTMNMIATVLPVLLWVLTLAGGIHLVYHFRKEYCDGTSTPQALHRAIDAVLVPYGVANFTTATGFLSLLFSNMEPVRNLGLWSAVGLVICYVSNIILLPVLLRLGLHLPFAAKMTSPPPLPIRTIRKVIHRHRWWIGTAGIVALLVPLLLVPRLRTESNVLSFFKDDARINQDYSFITQHLTGLSTIELDFRGPRPELSAYLVQFGQRIKELHGIDPVAFPVPEGIRMSIFAEEMDSMAFNNLVEQLRDILAQLPAHQLDIRLTGSIVLLNSIQEELVRTQLRSFAMALAIIVVVLAITFRSLVMVVIGSIVNLFPVLILAGIAAATGIPLNVATIMIASIAIGIAVDDTVFFLVRLRKEIVLGQEGTEAIDRTLSHMFGPISSTTLVVTVGFLVLGLAEFKPVAYFGLLGGLTMVLAWIGDVVLLPALLYCFSPRFNK
jgi:predicted RND superfamily exporter protein